MSATPHANGAAVNPFFAGRDALIASSKVNYPYKYRYRIYAQIALAALLFSLCITHIVLTLLHLRKRGKPLKIVRLQRLRAGRLIVTNTLFLYSCLTASSALVIALGRWKRLDVIFLGGNAHNQTVLNVLTIGPALLSANFYCFSNLAASLSLNRAARGVESVTRTWILAHNSGLCLLLLFYLCTYIPFGTLANVTANKILDRSTELIVLLTQAGAAVQAGSDPSAFVPQIAKAQADILEWRREATRYSRVIAVVNVLYATFFATSTLATFSFVSKLRRQAQWNRTRGIVNTGTGPSILVQQERTVHVEGASSFPEPPAPVVQPSPVLTFGRTFKAGKMRSAADQTEAEAALTRLAYDLTISLPFVTLMALWFIFLGIFGTVNTSTNATIVEMKGDGFSWPELLSNNIIMTFFIVNLIRNPGRYGQSGSDKSTGSQSKSAGVSGVGQGSEAGQQASVAKGFHIAMQPYPASTGPSHVADTGSSRPFEFSTVHFDGRSGSLQKGDDDETSDPEKEKW